MSSIIFGKYNLFGQIRKFDWPHSLIIKAEINCLLFFYKFSFIFRYIVGYKLTYLDDGVFAGYLSCLNIDKSPILLLARKERLFYFINILVFSSMDYWTFYTLLTESGVFIADD